MMDISKPKQAAQIALEEAWTEATLCWHKHIEECQICGFESNFCPEGQRLRLENKSAYQALRKFEASA